MAVYRASTSNIYGKDYSITPGFDAVAYRNANAGKQFVEQTFTGSNSWTRPNGVEFVELLLVGAGGGGGGSSGDNDGRRGGGGGGAEIFYAWINVGYTAAWTITIGSGGSGGGRSGCSAELWGKSGNTSSFKATASSNFSNHGYTAIGGGGGGHPCGGYGQMVATGGGSGSSRSDGTLTRNYGESGGAFNTGIGFIGGGGGGGTNDTAGGGGSVVAAGTQGTGAAGITLLGRAVGGGGAGGQGTSGGSGGGSSDGNATINTGGGGGGGNGGNGGSGGSGLCVIRYYV
jgi:hypothetical protein